GADHSRSRRGLVGLVRIGRGADAMTHVAAQAGVARAAADAAATVVDGAAVDSHVLARRRRRTAHEVAVAVRGADGHGSARTGGSAAESAADRGILRLEVGARARAIVLRR